jgi:hypothetical protein
MKFLYLATLLAAANAFTATSPSVISTLGEKSISNNVFADSAAHRTRRATIVMDGKANGKATRFFVLSDWGHLRTSCAKITRTIRGIMVAVRPCLIQDFVRHTYASLSLLKATSFS